MKFQLRSLVTVIVAALAMIMATSMPANANAYGSAGWGPRVTYNGVGISMGTYYVGVVGSGTYVNYVKGYPNLNTQFGTLCNWNITAEFFDANGKWYKTYNGPKHYTCNSYWKQANTDYIYIRATMKRGKMCSTLKQNGARLTSVCHSIY